MSNNFESIQNVLNGNAAKHLGEVTKLREEFLANPDAIRELKAYEAREDNCAYVILKGLIPPALVGQSSNGIGMPWRKSDTFFTDYALHYPRQRILSESENSYIICNNAAHDVRLYSSDVNLSGVDKSSSAGMSYMHLLVIPKSKASEPPNSCQHPHLVYNVVSLKDSTIIDELETHFRDFWRRADAVALVNDAINETMERRYNDLIESYRRSDNTQRIAHLYTVMLACRSSAKSFATQLSLMEDRDVVFGFHAHPHASVGHLHMHVLLNDGSFRHHSTFAHDWKTVSVKVIRDILQRQQK
ncbi:hypothetical protein ONZ45_g15169 [Pleurotus djamor]|nr:hypothetical protein ONZ45_g15169 [Pleurotus djamor]